MWIEANRGPTDGRVESAPADVVSSAFQALGRGDREGLMAWPGAPSATGASR
jgi:hypothetical protein